MGKIYDIALQNFIKLCTHCEYNTCLGFVMKKIHSLISRMPTGKYLCHADIAKTGGKL